ncbi:polysaccharide biosynthesis tyrosine autokinase [Ancylothrix sp. C2]|uniref:GumC family protein n=1 Tax=Ancylothrix sp. D3o TaxID=2953691 RepID=UPI0021BA86F3|nr:polysaccharide biosynthesis tyrosine autokinase [Ancylothrix sp. D3o]MCT7950776.1 polysaccharide biosynthesis tyrosine autokinase [Ancylothrix sp. D3o]
MDTEYHFQSPNSKRNSPPPTSLTANSKAVTPGEGEEQALDLAWVFSAVRRRLIVMLGVAVAISAAAGSAVVWNNKQIPKEYQGSFRVLVEPVTAEGRIARLFLQAQSVNEGVGDISRIGAAVEDSSLLDYQTQIRLLKSPEILAPVIDQLKAKVKDPDSISYSSLVNRLSISRVMYERDGKQAGTKLLNFTYQDEEPQKIKLVLNTLADYVLDYSRKERLSQIQKAISFIDSQLPELRQRVDKLQAQLQKLRQESNLSLPEITSRSQADQSNVLAIRLLDVQTQLAETRAYYNNLQQQLDRGDTTWLVQVNPKAYESIIGQLNAINNQLSINSAIFYDDSAPIQSLREQQKSLNQSLQQQAQAALENIAGQIRQLEARERQLSESQDVLNQQIEQFPSVLRQYTDLQRELEVATDSLKLFLEKRETMQLGAAQQQVNWTLVAKPDLIKDEEGRLISVTISQTSRQLAIVVVLSLLLGIGVGFLVEVLNTVFHTPEEARFATKLPLLGVIPYAKTLDKVNVPPTSEPLTTAPSSTGGLNLVLGNVNTSSRTDTTKPVKEAFRYLYTNIRLLNPQNPIRSFAIGSASIGDGKSTVAVHLAQTAAAIGQRVLLVDADLRCPKIHTKLGLPNVRGLSDAIATDMGLNDVIQRAHSVWSEEIPGQDNLFVLTAGSLPPDPIKLLSSNKMLYLMEQFQAFFDLVIYDTPPLVGLADANIIGAHTDGMVLVVSMEKTDRSVLIKAMEGLKISGASVLGLVANGAKGSTPSPYAKVR